MLLSDFIKLEEERLMNFVLMWSKEHKKNPEQYPLELEPGDWDEQLLAFTPNEQNHD